MRALLSVITLALGLSACGGGDGGSEVALRVIHASPDAPRVNFLLNGIAVRSLVDFQQGTQFNFLTAGRYDIALEAVLPVQNEKIVDLAGTSLQDGREYTAVMIGRTGDDSIDSVLLDNPLSAVGAASFRIQLLHAAPAVGAVDIFLTAATDPLAGATPLATLTYGGFSTRTELPVPVPASARRVRITAAGAADPDNSVIFDSGELTFASLDDLLAVVTQNAGAGDSPVALVINNRFVTTPVDDAGAPAEIRVVHLVPDAPALDACVDVDGIYDVAQNRFACDGTGIIPPALTYGGVTGYQRLQPDNYALVISRSDDPLAVVFPSPDLLDPPLIDPDGDPADPDDDLTTEQVAAALEVLESQQEDFTLLRARRTTILLTRLLDELIPVPVLDLARPVNTEAKLRFINGSPAAGTIDVYLLLPGGDLATASPSLVGLGLGGSVGHLSYAPQTLTVVVTKRGTKDELTRLDLALAAGGVSTFIVRDAQRPDAASTGLPVGTLVISDLT